MYWQGYGPQSVEEKQKLLRLLRNLNFNGESVSEPYTPTAQSLGTIPAADGFYSPELRGEFGAGLLDLHAMDDTELLSEVIIDSLYISKCYYFGGYTGLLVFLLMYIYNLCRFPMGLFKISTGM